MLHVSLRTFAGVEVVTLTNRMTFPLIAFFLISTEFLLDVTF